ncbi:cytidylate kinase family protein [Candidatus Gottesmanbacteria bacterium]|nr:cytidylate kinase family protein [Candidatus Gottesmanbacteria bacterium]
MYNKVTISGKICTGKTTLFWLLQKKLGWPTFSASQYFRDYSRSTGVSLQKAEEQNPNLTREVDLRMKKLLLEEEHILLEGWMAGIMADQIPDVLRILLRCEDVERTNRFAKREKVSDEEAKASIEERERNLFTKLDEIYHRSDFVNPKNYNLIIDTTRKPLEEPLGVVLKAIKNDSASGQKANS